MTLREVKKRDNDDLTFAVKPAVTNPRSLHAVAIVIMPNKRPRIAHVVKWIITTTLNERCIYSIKIAGRGTRVLATCSWKPTSFTFFEQLCQIWFTCMYSWTHRIHLCNQIHGRIFYPLWYICRHPQALHRNSKWNTVFYDKYFSHKTFGETEYSNWIPTIWIKH